MKSFLKITALSAAATLCFTATPLQADLVVLQYHHVDDSTPRSTSTSPSLFRDQLELVDQLGLEVAPLLPATRAALKGEGPESNQVAISFECMALQQVQAGFVGRLCDEFGISIKRFADVANSH